ncbi:MAG: helix-turn-helix domain-containing protein [Oscillospiraceae bacterium]|nr:helix-turn-helix domain-containing protein [Oscillospiraceae bacterium]
MITNYVTFGQRIGYLRRQRGLSQEELAERVNLSREFISMVENNKMGLGVDSLVNIANSLGVSADDILVDCLEYSVSTADSELHRLLLDCNETEEYILTQTAKVLKEVLSAQGI